MSNENETIMDRVLSIMLSEIEARARGIANRIRDHKEPMFPSGKRRNKAMCSHLNSMAEAERDELAFLNGLLRGNGRNEITE